MEISSNSQIQNLNQVQKTDSQSTQTQTQSQSQNPYQALQNNQSQTTNLEAQLKQTLLNLLQNLADNTQSKTEILDMLKSTNLFKDFSNASNLLKSILNGVLTNPSLQKFQVPIQNFLTNIENISSENLKANLNNSGVFLESKLLANQKQNITSDMKAVLLNLKQELDISPNGDKELLKQVDKMLIQIDYYQLLSLSSNSQFSFIPFEWEELEDGDISFYKEQEEFVCSIDLKLKEFGEVKVNLRLIDEKTLNINFFIEDEEFKNILRENFPKLRQNIQKQGLKIANLSLKEIEPDKAPNNPYKSNSSLSINLDIRA